MIVQSWVWIATLTVLVGLLAVDVLVIGRRPHEPSMRECATAIALFVGLAVLFGAGLLVVAGPQPAGEFFAGWLTEYSLSIDNLFVFVIIMSRLSVPRHLQQSALLIGIILALVLRGIFIGLGAAAIASASWVFYLFGAFLVYTAVRLATAGIGGAEEPPDNAVLRLLRLVRRRFPVSPDFHGPRLTTRAGGRRLATPMLFVVLALGTTDLLFALDSIPAIYGLTKQPYLVLAANVFALMGLRQLYFLLGGLLERLVYLSRGLAVVLAFIGVKLVLEALHGNELPLVNHGRSVPVPEIPVWLSLVVIVATLAVTTTASLLVSGRARSR